MANTTTSILESLAGPVIGGLVAFCSAWLAFRGKKVDVGESMVKVAFEERGEEIERRDREIARLEKRLDDVDKKFEQIKQGREAAEAETRRVQQVNQGLQDLLNRCESARATDRERIDKLETRVKELELERERRNGH